MHQVALHLQLNAVVLIPPEAIKPTCYVDADLQSSVQLCLCTALVVVIVALTVWAAIQPFSLWGKGTVCLHFYTVCMLLLWHLSALDLPVPVPLGALWCTLPGLTFVVLSVTVVQFTCF